MPSDVSPADPGNETRILILPPTLRDADAMRKLLGVAGIACEFFSDTASLCDALEQGAGAVIVSEEEIADDSELLTACIARQPVWADLPVIVLSHAGTESAALARNIPRLGNVSVVERPVRTTTLVSLVQSALRARSRQYQVRDQLAQRQRAEQIIREAEQRYRLLIENIRDYAIFMTDVEGRVTSWNDGSAQILGYSQSEILGHNVEIFFTPEDRAAKVPQKEMEIAGRSGRAADRRWHLRKGGERFYVDGVLTAVRDENGQLMGYSKLMKDVTIKHRADIEREILLESERRARTEAERAGRMKDEFLATLSHELRTPLNAILGWSQLLRRSPDSVDVAEGLVIIERNARSQTQIIEDLLDMSRIISGKVRLEMAPLHLSAVVMAAVETVRLAAQAKNIRLDVVVDPLAIPIHGDANRLQQVVWNLLTNAVKFTPKDGRVEITLKRSGSQVELSISDTGEGIGADFLPQVFDRFRQADASTTRRHGGLGLGLSIAKQLVELHGGTIGAQSPGIGQGATFRVSLPLVAANPQLPGPQDPVHHEEPAPAPVPQRTNAAADLKGIKILVVDDEPDARSLIRRLLEDKKATVITAGSANEAIDTLSRERPDVLISDIGMPGEDGYALIRHIRSLNNHQSATPAIALSAYARFEDRIKAIDSGFQLYLSKPVEPAELFLMISSLIE